jgi:P27 family predicted phage terminase small subunit
MPSREPRSLKLMRGTLRKDREPADPLTPRPGKARPPKWLPPAERTAFRQLVTETERTGTPTKSFTYVLTGAALAWTQLERCTAVLAEKGETYESTTTSGGLKIVARPEVQLRNTAMRLLKVYLVELGLTPAAIGRLDLSAMPRRPADPGRFKRFFGNKAARVPPSPRDR